MSEIFMVGLDLAKNVFQVHGADGGGRAVLRKNLRRAQVLEFFQPAASLRCRDGSLRRRSFPGTRDRQAGPRRAAHPARLRHSG